jgi:preprotein translocase subunit SecD
MGIIRDSFVILKNWAAAIEELPEEYQLETYKALMSYGLTGQMPENLSAIARAMLVSFSVSMENNISRYNASVENGKKGGRPKKEEPKNDTFEAEKDTETQETKRNLEKPRKTYNNLEEPNPNLNVNDNDNVNVNVFKVSKKESKEIDLKNNNTQARESYEDIMEDFGVSRQLKPTLWEFIQHCLANGHVITNSKLEDIIIELDKQDDESDKVGLLKRAISGGYYDVKRFSVG